jgi:hypothetical protein
MAIKGRFTFHLPDGDVVWCNHILDAGMKKMMRVLADNTETDINLDRMAVGDSAATPNDRTLTALVNEETTQRYDIGSHSVNASFPFDLELTATIPDDKITRPYTVKEIAIYFGASGNEIFSRATDATGVLLPASTAVPITYDLVVV